MMTKQQEDTLAWYAETIRKTQQSMDLCGVGKRKEWRSRAATLASLEAARTSYLQGARL